MTSQLSRPELSRSIRALTCGLESAGWSIRCFELDMSTDRARIELVRLDVGPTKRVVNFFSRDGQSSITRELEYCEPVTIGRRGDRFIAYRLRSEFLGRQSYPGARIGLRYLCSYLADNSTRAIGPAHIRALLAPVMNLSACHAQDSADDSL